MATTVRPLLEEDLAAADRIFRLAFGTFERAPDPEHFGGDADCIRSRWRADPGAALAADYAGELAGSVFVAHWGSFACFGPLTVRPDLWDKGVGSALMEGVIGLLEQWGVRQAGLATFPHSVKHVGLYQKFGFWPQHLIANVSKPVGGAAAEWSKYSEPGELAICRTIAGAVFDGLDLAREISAVHDRRMGETVLLPDGAGFAVCHCGAGSEAGSGACYVKFGAVRAGRDLPHLLGACEALATERGLAKLTFGISTARHEAYRQALSLGFRITSLNLAMQRPNQPGYNRPDVYALDDWR